MSQSAILERNTTPELTTPAFKNEQLRASGQNLTTAFMARLGTADKSAGVHICCHEQAKQHALAQQKIQFMQEQLSDEQNQSKMKEKQFNQIISALKKTAEENNARKHVQQLDSDNQNLNPSQKELKDTYAELNSKTEEVNELQEKVLKLELQAEKTALDYKIKV